MSRLHREVKSIEDQVQAMATLAQGMLQDGVKALEALDVEKGESVLRRADALAQMDEDIETHILRTFALEEPVARDLRRIGTALKLITYINRVGRYGYDIAKVATAWPTGEEHISRMVSIPSMAQKVEAMMSLALSAFTHNVAPDTDAVMALEVDVDALRYTVWRECLTFMAQDNHHIERCAHYMMVARYLERCGDNIVKMAEKQHWSATGERILLD